MHKTLRPQEFTSNVPTTYRQPPPPYRVDSTQTTPTTFDQLPADEQYDTALHSDIFATKGQQQSSNTVSNVPLKPGLSRPVVLPQTSKTFRGAFFSPFVRAYTPELETHGIDQSTFLTFIDGLNECFVAHPIFQSLGIAGGVMTAFYGVHPVQWAGIGLQVSSGVASAATSYFRTKAYVKAVNADLWHPAGLHVSILTTKKMMAKVEYPDEKITLPPLELVTDLHGETMSKSMESDMNLGIHPDDPRMRRIRALDGYVMPLDFDVPAAVTPDGLFRRMGNSQAQRMARKQQKKQWKQREDYVKAAAEADAVRKYGDKGLAKKEKKIAKLGNRLNGECSPEKREKIIHKQDKAQEKLMKQAAKEKGKKSYAKDLREHEEEADKELRKLNKKEQKVAHKIRWIVISRWEPNSDEESEDSRELPSADRSSDEEI